MKKSFNNKKLLHHKSKHHETQADAPSPLRAFQRYEEHNLKPPHSELSKSMRNTISSTPVWWIS